ncbi:MAG: hypothetical protein FJ202_09090, partial [Gemmatimonadetes bacterium]|nr:hypothetical protein [Gemmatimonadota bacterium]
MSLAAAASAPPGGVPRAARGSNRSLAVPIVVSGVLHVVVLGALAYRAGTDSRAMPPMYRVNIVAAPP